MIGAIKLKISKFIVNCGARLYSKGYVTIAVYLWSIPFVMRYSSPVNIRKYLSHLSDIRFKNFLSRNYFKFLKDDELYLWAYSEAKSRSIEDLTLLMDKSIFSDLKFVVSYIDMLFAKRDYVAIKNTSHVVISNRERYQGIELCDEQKLRISVILDDYSMLPDKIDVSIHQKSICEVLLYAREVKAVFPKPFLNNIESNIDTCSQNLSYTYCQYLQSLNYIEESITQWGLFVLRFPDVIRAKQNLLLQLCKKDDYRLVPLLKELDNSNALNDKLIKSSFRSLNRINSVDLIREVEFLKKKNRYALRVILEVFRKNDFMSVLPEFEHLYSFQYGKDGDRNVSNNGTNETETSDSNEIGTSDETGTSDNLQNIFSKYVSCRKWRR